jgi:hypothetical protein
MSAMLHSGLDSSGIQHHGNGIHLQPLVGAPAKLNRTYHEFTAS